MLKRQGLLTIGLTGTPGSGKSTAASMLGALGAAVLDADQMARRVVEPPSPVLDEIARRFGPELIQADGSLDRRAMGALVFADSDRRRELEGLIHPEVTRLLEAELDALQAEPTPDGAPRPVVLDIPLLFEAGLEGLADRILVVTVDEAARRRRLREARGWSDEEIDRRLAAQWPQASKAARADAVVDNSGPPEATRRALQDIYRQWLDAARSGAPARAESCQPKE